MLRIDALTRVSFGSATATPRAAVEMSTIQTKRFFHDDAPYVLTLGIGHGVIVFAESLTR